MREQGKLLESSNPLSAPQRSPLRLSALKRKIVSAIALMGGCAIAVFPQRTLAQSNIVPDATLGAERSFVVPNFNGLPVEAIGGGAVRGQNLFHSFQEFNVSEGRGAYFFSPNAAIQNILARVTGNNPSQILGTLGTFGSSQPNLFLINPNGIIFGRNARLDVRGSLFASTADSVVFDNGFAFSATNPQAPPLLTINVPLGLQFGVNPGRIVNQSVFGLAVQPGRTLALVGGEVAIAGGFLFAPDGRVELGSVAGNNQVNLTPTLTGYLLGYDSVENFQDISLTQAAVVDSSGEGGGSIQVQGRNVTLSDETWMLANTGGSQNGGGISINASRLTLEDGSWVTVYVSDSGSGDGGSLTVNASESVQVLGLSGDGQRPSGLFAVTDGTGRAGDLTITTKQLLVSGGAQIIANTGGSANGGSLRVNASESVQLIGTSPDSRFVSGLKAQSNRGATGTAGDLTINTAQLLVSDGAQVSAGTFGSGDGGSLRVNASDSVQVMGIAPNGQYPSGLFTASEAIGQRTGTAGDLTITTGQLFVSEGGRVSASTDGGGNGGSVIINASDIVQVLGTSANGRVPSTLSADTFGTGNAGDLTITTPRLLIRDGAKVSASTFGSGDGGNLTVNAFDSVRVIGHSMSGEFSSAVSAQANPNSTGNAGDLTINTGKLLIQDGAEVSVSTFGFGNAGNLTVNASDRVQLIGRSFDGQPASNISANTMGTGNAGNLSITTSQLLVRDGAQVGAGSFGSGKGGNLTVNASDSVQLIGQGGQFPSGLFTRSEGTGTNEAGDITITTGRLLVSNEAQISASAFAGDAGDLTINTGQLLIRDGSQVSAGTFGSGKGGNLTVNASDTVQVIGSLLTAQADLNSTGNAGDLTITTGQLLIRDGGEVSASTFGSGKGGNLIVKASDSVQLSGASGIFVDAGAGGTAGNLTLETGQISVQGGSRVTVSSPFGQAGNMSITVDSLTLNQGSITAVTGTSGAEGGANITLQGLDLLRMDNESLISASALEGANGGNVTIDSTFIVATPPTGSKGSDITANAVRGNGGNVNVTTQGLFGIEFRPRLTPDNDITASSEFGVAGIVNINTPGVDPSRGLSELPSDVVDATQQIDRRCTPAAADQKSRFVITGRGGLPPSPNDTLQGESVVTHWVTLDSEENTNGTAPQPHPTRTAPRQLVEAQSWLYGANGEVILTAQAPTATPGSPWQVPPSCDAVGREEKEGFNAEGRRGWRGGSRRS